jgi:hypothetical protein
METKQRRRFSFGNSSVKSTLIDGSWLIYSFFVIVKMHNRKLQKTHSHASRPVLRGDQYIALCVWFNLHTIISLLFFFQFILFHFISIILFILQISNVAKRCTNIKRYMATVQLSSTRNTNFSSCSEKKWIKNCFREIR